MKSYLDLVSLYAKAHKKKNRLTVICIAISVMLVAAIFGMADMSVKAQINEQIRKNGNFHVMLYGLSENAEQQIGGRNDIQVTGRIAQTEDAFIQGKTLRIMGGDKDIAEQMNIALSEGQFPVSTKEALIDEQARTQFDLSVGDTVDIVLENGQTIEYIISGIYSDFSSLKGSDSHGLFLSMDGIKELPLEEYSEFYVLQFKKGTNIRRAISDIKTDYNLVETQVAENTLLLGVMGQSDNSSIMQMYLMAGILFVLVLTAGTFMIASSFNMSVLERTQFFGLLRCLGATKKQIKRYIRLEGLRYCFVGIPIGLLGGCIVMWAAALFLKALDTSVFPDMPLFQISWMGLLAGAALGLLTVMMASSSPAKKASKVSPQAAVTGNINNTDNQKINRSSNTKLFRVDTAMGISHAFSNKKNMVLMTGSFTISIILFLCFTVIITFVNHALKPLRPYAPDISVMGTENSVLLDRLLYEEIKALPGIKNIYGRMFYYDIPVKNEQTKITLISYETKQFEWSNEQLINGNINDVQNGNGVLVVYSDALKWSVGDTIDLHLRDGVREVTVTGILSNSPFDIIEGMSNVICSEQTFTNLTGISDYTIIDIQVEEDISEQVRSLITPQMQLRDKQQDNRDIRTAYNSMMVFVYGFLIVIAFVALINIINTVNASVSSRINNYGVMRAVGMSGRQLKRMVTAEAASYAITGSIVGCLIGLLLHRLLFRLIIESIWGEAWQPPLAVLSVTIIIAILTTFIAVIPPIKKLQKMSIVNVVNAQ
jgi:putative ABC transport system permease protein